MVHRTLLQLAFVVALAAASGTTYTAVVSGSTFKVYNRAHNNAACTASYEGPSTTEGWSTLVLESNSSLSDLVQAKACGFLEGYLQHERIVIGAQDYHEESDDVTKMKTFLTTNKAWIDSHSTNKSTYWKQVRLVYAQMEAIAAGCASAAPEANITVMDLMLMNAARDTDDLMGVIERRRVTAPRATLRVTENSKGHCSVLIRNTGTDLIVGHTTWAAYSMLLRTLKTYKLHLSGVATTAISQSGYPGVIASIDDFYVTSGTRLVVTETTNCIYNVSMFDYVHPESVLYWVRATVATRLATDGNTWVQLFRLYDSCTYNNQWMVVDMKKYNATSHSLSTGVLTVSETASNGLWKHGDMTSVLKAKGYWSSYNSPYFKEIYNAMGYDIVYKLYGDLFSTENCPRAKIFQRDAPNTASVSDVKTLIRSNSYLTDSLTGGYPGNAIASRYDLLGGPDTPGLLEGYNDQAAYGSTDAKVTSASMLFSTTPKIQAIYGPPVTSECPPFSYTGLWVNETHDGQPKRFNYSWIDYRVPF